MDAAADTPLRTEYRLDTLHDCNGNAQYFYKY